MSRMNRITGLVAGAMLAAVAASGQVQVQIQQKAEAYTAPKLLTVTNGAVTTVFTTNNVLTRGRILYRGIQNTGTNAFLYLIGSTNVSSTNFTGVVAGGLAVRDGCGSMVDLSRVPRPVSLTTESGATTVSVVELTQ